jgi:hypothetical protein
MSISRISAFVLFGCLFGGIYWTTPSLANDGQPSSAQKREEPDVPYGVGDWPESLGNHRAKIEVENKADAVWVHLPWRRRDESPERKEIMIFDASNQQVKNVLRARITKESGDLVFQAAAPGTYHVYYMPFRLEGEEYCPRTVYLPLTDAGDPAWKAAAQPLAEKITSGTTDGLPRARVVEFQAINEFHRFDPMEVPATDEERKNLVEQSGKPFLIVPEDRRFPIRMHDALPLRWIRSGVADRFAGEARRGEYYVFQLGVVAPAQDVADIQYSAQRFDSDENAEFGAVTCFNLEGTDWQGQPIKKSVSVPKGQVQPLWFGVQVPKDAAPGKYTSTITIRPGNFPAASVEVTIKVNDRTIRNAGDDDLWRLARLRWLNSTIGLDDEVFSLYTPVEVADRNVRVLGRALRFGGNGLPESIQSTFGKSVDRLDAPPQEILAAPVRFLVERNDKTEAFAGGEPAIVEKHSGAVVWESTSHAGSLALRCRAKLECDGCVSYSLSLTGDPKEATELKDIKLEIPLRLEIAKYMMGLGRKGGIRPEKWEWKWDARYANSHFWIGDTSAGVGGKFKHLEDRWDYFNMQKSGPYEHWANGGKGGVTLREEDGRVVLAAYTGPRKLEAGAELHFNFQLLITPFHPIDSAHWQWRYMHPYPWTPLPTADEAAASGAKILTVHQGGNGINQHINYPFVTTEAMKRYIDAVHAKGMKLKIYYTMRELSNYTAELSALRSLGDEVYLDGPGFHLADTFDKEKNEKPAADAKTPTGSSWLVEHLVDHYVPAWHQPLGNGKCDSAIATQGLSRWHNYYLEGLSWLIREQGIDGLYLDGAGFDREITKRIRKVMDRARPGCLIDFHEGNSFSYSLNNSSSLHLDKMPCINSLWFGEMYNYNESPDYWLVEMSGIPYGLTGEMLQDGGNPWRGMLYGMTNRLPWSGDPRPIWKAWDDFGIDKSRMIGYWDPACPVKTHRDDILATAYLRDGRTLIAVASWAAEKQSVGLDIDWKSLGINSDKATLVAPSIAKFQPAAEFASSAKIPVEPGRGWLLILKEK